MQTTVLKADKENNVVTQKEHAEISRNLMMYAEHTWGHSASFSDPCKLLVKQLDFRKSKYATEADILACKAFDKLCVSFGEGEFTTRKPFKFAVVNPHDFETISFAKLSTDFWEEGLFTGGKFDVVDESGISVKFQRNFTLRGAVIVCELKLKAAERKVLKIVFHKEHVNSGINSPQKFTYKIENNEIVSVKADGVTEILSNAEGLGRPLYQLFKNGIRSDAAGFGYGKRKKPAGEIFTGKAVKSEITDCGEVFTRIKTAYEIAGCKRFEVYTTLYNNASRIDLEAEFAKDLEMDAEGLYISLPLKIDGGHWRLDKAGAMSDIGVQLPKCCCDYFTVNRGAVLSNNDITIAVNTLDTPLLTFEKIKLWDYTTQINDGKPMYSWVLNNKWETNFRSECAGFYQTRYIINFEKGRSENQLLQLGDDDFITVRG